MAAHGAAEDGFKKEHGGNGDVGPMRGEDPGEMHPETRRGASHQRGPSGQVIRHGGRGRCRMLCHVNNSSIERTLDLFLTQYLWR